MNDAAFRSVKAMRLAGISYRQLNYWCMTGLVVPSIEDEDGHGSGSQRLYSFRDVVSLRVVKLLLNTGISLQKIRKVTRYISEAAMPNEGELLLSDGVKVYTGKGYEDVAELLGKGDAVFGISLAAVYLELESVVEHTTSDRIAVGSYREGEHMEKSVKVTAIIDYPEGADLPAKGSIVEGQFRGEVTKVTDTTVHLAKGGTKRTLVHAVTTDDEEDGTFISKVTEPTDEPTLAEADPEAVEPEDGDDPTEGE